MVTRLGRPASGGKADPSAPESGVARRGCWVRGHYWPRLDNREAIARYGLYWREPHFRQGTGDSTDEGPTPRVYIA